MENQKGHYTTILSVAGSDSSAGAGIQADIKTAQLMGVHCMTALTSVTAQSSRGVITKFDLPADLVASQIELAFTDEPPSAVKTGMLPTVDIIRRTATLFERLKPSSIVIDPVLISTSGLPLCSPLDECAHTLKKYLFPLATLVTPNIPEATYLCGGTLPPLKELPIKLHTNAVLLKGGHARSKGADDILITSNEILLIPGPRIKSQNTHGTGCVLSSAIASLIAKGHPLTLAVKKSKEFITQAISTGADFQFGNGYGPLYLLPRLHIIKDQFMNIIINGQPINIPSETITVAAALELKKIPRQGTAVAINSRLCRASEWETTLLKEGDELTVISATFGG